MAVVEISVESVASALAAEEGGAQRVELCSALREGGVTPSLGLLRATRARLALSLQVLIRPRSGDFLYSNEDFAIMRDDVVLAAREGADGVVFGILTPAGEVDVERTRELTELAHPMQVTFHRAIDMARDLDAALGDILRCGCDRVLTSGGAASAMQGREQLRALVQAADERIAVMAGGGVRPANVAELARATDIAEFHASLRSFEPSPMRYLRHGVHLGQAEGIEYARTVVHPSDVRALVEAVQHLPGAVAVP